MAFSKPEDTGKPAFRQIAADPFVEFDAEVVSGSSDVLGCDVEALIRCHQQAAG